MTVALRKGGPEPGLERPALHRPRLTPSPTLDKLRSFSWGTIEMKVLASVVFTLLFTGAAFGQDDERIKRIVERIEKEIRESHDRTREEIRAIIRAEIQRATGKAPAPAPVPRATPAPSSKKVVLGITADDMTDAERKALGIGGGIKIAAVRGPAADAGLKPGDILIELDGEAVTEDRIGEILSKRRPGDSVPVKVLRAKQAVKLTVVLGERKD